jgi:hypothetical protein
MYESASSARAVSSDGPVLSPESSFTGAILSPEPTSSVEETAQQISYNRIIYSMVIVHFLML